MNHSTEEETNEKTPLKQSDNRFGITCKTACKKLSPFLMVIGAGFLFMVPSKFFDNIFFPEKICDDDGADSVPLSMRVLINFPDDELFQSDTYLLYCVMNMKILKPEIFLESE